MENLTINGVEYAPVQKMAEKTTGEKLVLIRSYGSGVHFGVLASKRDCPQGLEVTLTNSRRVHYWVGAASLSQMATEGIANAADSRVTVVVSEITISNVIEIIPLTDTAFVNLSNQPVWKM